MATGPRFWNRVARRYERLRISDVAAWEARLERTREYFTPESEVLEIGCGTGTAAVLHAPHVRRIRAVDFSQDMIAIARDKARGAGVDNIDFEIGSLEDLDAAPESFDVILAMSILHLLDNRREAIARLFELLRPGGVLVSSTPCLRRTPAAGTILLLGRALRILPAISFLNRGTLLAEFRAAGFGIEEEWLPGKGLALFAVARKPDRGSPRGSSRGRRPPCRAGPGHGLCHLRLASCAHPPYIAFNSGASASTPEAPPEILTGRAPVFLCPKGPRR